MPSPQISLLRLDPKFNWVYISKSSIHGLGLFARLDLARGEKLGLALIKKTEAPIELLPHLIEGFAAQASDPWWRVIGARFINHQLNGNLFLEYNSGQVVVTTLRPISKDEELTADYSLIYPKLSIPLPEFVLINPTQSK